MLWSLKTKRRRRGWCSCGLLPPLCVTYGTIRAARVYAAPVAAVSATWGHPWCPGCEHPGWPNLDIPGEAPRWKYFLAKETGNGDCSKNQDFTAVKPPVPVLAVLVLDGLWLFSTVPLNEDSHSETVRVLQLPGCSYRVGQFREHLFCRRFYGWGHWAQWEPRSASPLF